MFSHAKMFCGILLVAFLGAGCTNPSAQAPTPESLEVLECIEGWNCVHDAADMPATESAGADQFSTPYAPQPKPSAISARPRQVFLTQFQGKVTVQDSVNGSHIPAQFGMSLPVGTSIRTESSGSATLNIQPEGTKIRIGANSAFTLMSLIVNTDGRPGTRIELGTGKLWVLPNGGQIVIKTTMGTAATDNGSPLGVSYDPTTAILQASCLQGICSLGNEEGEIVLTTGMMAIISRGELPYSSQQMDGQNLQEWVDENPGLQNYFGGQIPGWLPTPDH